MRFNKTQLAILEALAVEPQRLGLGRKADAARALRSYGFVEWRQGEKVHWGAWHLTAKGREAVKSLALEKR